MWRKVYKWKRQWTETGFLLCGNKMEKKMPCDDKEKMTASRLDISLGQVLEPGVASEF